MRLVIRPEDSEKLLHVIPSRLNMSAPTSRKAVHGLRTPIGTRKKSTTKVFCPDQSVIRERPEPPFVYKDLQVPDVIAPPSPFRTTSSKAQDSTFQDRSSTRLHRPHRIHRHHRHCHWPRQTDTHPLRAARARNSHPLRRPHRPYP